ncbi:MAG: hypothetical protein DMG39_16060 [Acidobacteria bacterium]|nr:MAG: hypothetical protein DMG39_16060 [Acidobacteriota bacterium]
MFYLVRLRHGLAVPSVKMSLRPEAQYLVCSSGIDQQVAAGRASPAAAGKLQRNPTKDEE